METMRRMLTLTVVLGATLSLLGCGSGSPSSPSGTGGVAVRGVLLDEGAAFTASSGSTSGRHGTIEVSIEGTTIKTTVAGNGTFEIEDMEPGTFTIVFSLDGVEIGRFTVTAGDGVEVRIVVKLEDEVIVLVDLELSDDDDDATGSKTCMIEGGRAGERIELEGNVTGGDFTGGFQMVAQGNRSRGREVDVMTSGGTGLKCNGKTSDCMGSVRAGAKVHVRGNLSVCTTEHAEIEASEVKVQKAGAED